MIRQMKKILKNIVTGFLVALMFTSSSMVCFAEAERGSIAVTLEKQGTKIDGMTVLLCQIAELNNTGYYPTAPFEGSGISLAGIVNNPDETAAQSVADYAMEHNVETVAKVAEEGTVTFSELKLGIWLVFCNETEKYSFNPFLVFLPYESGGKLYFEVSSAPKVEDNKPNEINICVFKKWDDKDNAAKKRPETVTVELLNGDTVVDAAELSEANGWSHTFYSVAKDGDYSVREKSIPDYKASYSGDKENGFSVTNTYIGPKLPQTGQHWWPIILIAIAGVGFVLLGIYEIGAKKNGKKK